MARRYTTSLLMMAYLASQLAMVPHAHGASSENVPSDHNARPHVHVSWFHHENHGHEHGDEHKHNQDCHHGDESHSQPAANTEPDDHDSDAVYVPNHTALSLSTKSAPTPDSFELVSTLTIATVPMPMAISRCSSGAYLPDECSSGCPLYPALRALRI